MVDAFHCFEFLLLRKLDRNLDLWNEVKVNIFKDKEYLLKKVSPDLWYFAVTLTKTKDRFPSFVRELVLKDPQYAPLTADALLRKYLRHLDFVEIYLDNIFRQGEDVSCLKELFHCQNVEILSLRSNFLKRLPAEIGNLQKLEYLALTNNKLQISSIPFTLTFCRILSVLLLDNNLLDALPGFLLLIPSLKTVHRHGNNNFFWSTFVYHTDANERILSTLLDRPPPKPELKSLKYHAAVKIIAQKMNFFVHRNLPETLVGYICDIYFNFNICHNCFSACRNQPGYKIFTFKNPYLGNTCVPFLHWACSIDCAEAIELPARVEQILTAEEQDRQYHEKMAEAQAMTRHRDKSESVFHLGCRVIDELGELSDRVELYFQKRYGDAIVKKHLSYPPCDEVEKGYETWRLYVANSLEEGVLF